MTDTLYECGPDCKGCDPCVCGHPWSDHDSSRERVCYGDWCDCTSFDPLFKPHFVGVQYLT